MANEYTIEKNNYLKKNTPGYYHQFYTGYKKENNPDYLNHLKNTFGSIEHILLEEARDKVVNILVADIPKIMRKRNITECMLVCVPRAKKLKSYLNSQLMFIDSVSIASRYITGTVYGKNCIERVINTRTTHLANADSIPNDGDMPYPGITAATCEIDKTRVLNQNIILIDDIYTRTVNIDEDCIQALLDNGAKEVIFYSVAYTKR